MAAVAALGAASLPAHGAGNPHVASRGAIGTPSQRFAPHGISAQLRRGRSRTVRIVLLLRGRSAALAATRKAAATLAPAPNEGERVALRRHGKPYATAYA